MSDSKKKRLSMLDGLAAVGAAPAASMMSTNRALRSARDAVDAHHVWELDPETITDPRPADRLDPRDMADLRASIEANGQTVPILVRRDPADAGRYLLVYGRRRLEAIRASDKVSKVRALIAQMDDSAALRAQITENTARRDLSYIERALFAEQLMQGEFGTQAQIAEVLNTTKSAISMALSVARAVGPDLARAIGPAPGIGRPRWEALARALEEGSDSREDLAWVAMQARMASDVTGEDAGSEGFEAVLAHVTRRAATAPSTAAAPNLASPSAAKQPLTLEGRVIGHLQAGPKGLRLDLKPDAEGFADFVATEAPALLAELHARWKQRA